MNLSTLQRVANRYASRTIQFDRSKVVEVTNQLLEEAFGKLRIITQTGQPIGVHPILATRTLALKNVKGREKFIEVTLGSRKGTNSRSTANGFFDTGKDAIHVFLNSMWPLDDLLQEEGTVNSTILSNLLHEVVHALDIINLDKKNLRSDGETLEERKKYLNQPEEIRAYAKQVVDEVLKAGSILKLLSTRSKKPLPRGSALMTQLLEKSVTFEKIEKGLYPSNLKLMYKIVARELEDAGFEL